MSHPIRPSLTVGTNSYLTKLEAETYFSTRLNHVAWDNLNDEDDVRALVTASQQISMLVSTDYKLPLVTIPQLLKDAVCELALSMASDLAVIDQADTKKNIKRVKAGSAEVEFFNDNSGSNTGARFPANVMNILQEGGYISSSVFIAPVASGTSCTSQFDNADIYGRLESFK